MENKLFTPIERGILIILMTQGKPVKQADLKNVHGLAVKKQHRQKLADRGFIVVNEKPRITYALTTDGWTWLTQELAAPRPKGSMGLGPLYAVLGAIDRLARKAGVSLENALKPEGPRPTEWIEADEYIARALQDIPIFGRTLSRLREAAKGRLSDDIENAELAAELVFQHIRLAAKKRALVLDGEVGSETAFDPDRFLSDDDVAFGDPVRVRKPPVTRTQGTNKILVQPGLADQM